MEITWLLRDSYEKKRKKALAATRLSFVQFKLTHSKCTTLKIQTQENTSPKERSCAEYVK